MSNSYITIKEAAKILSVSTLTLRNWDKNGRLKALRHPINNYRVYKKEDIENLMSDIEESRPQKSPKREFKKVIVRHLSNEQ